jgi:transposase
MQARFNQSFKLQAVEKALGREPEISLSGIAKSLGVGRSTLSKWICKSKNQTLDQTSTNAFSVSGTAFEKRPQDWTDEEKLNLVIHCGSMSDVEINQLCREQGLYAHHIKQWKDELGRGVMTNKKVPNMVENRRLKNENKALKKELIRKDKALAEAAALLLLQKKVQAIWDNVEGSSQ